MAPMTGCKRKQQPHEKPSPASSKEKTKQPRTAAGKPDAKPEEMSWPEEVREDAYRLYTARLHYANPAAVRLAQHGLDAVPAMIKVVTSKYQPVKKVAFVSMLIVELHIFRPDDLIRLASMDGLPFVQRAAIEALARLRLKRTEKALDALTAALKKLALELKQNPKLARRLKGPPTKGHPPHAGHKAGHGHGPQAGQVDPTVPLLRFLEQARHEKRAWNYSESELKALDRLYQAKTKQEILAALDWIKDPKLEKGLLAIIRSPAVRPEVAGAAIQRVLFVNDFKPEKLRQFCGSGYPRFLRMVAAKFLLKREGDRAEAFLSRLARKSGDPLAPYFEKLLQAQVSGR
jgi:hypothetical protein